MNANFSYKTLIPILLFFAGFVFSYAQTKIISGIVTDDKNSPLESANIIAKPLAENASLKFSIANNKGEFKLDLENNVKYEINVSYIGFIEENKIIEISNSTNTLDFRLKPTGEELKEIIIKHEYKPIIIKKDTITFNVKSFANGNERKMKEILEKLPGVEVDKKGNVTVQGKKVTQMLVEGKSFFGGGSKLAVENIPADVLDKIEVIDHFNTVGFMKQVSDSDELAMNVKLKEDKKKFVFGDIQAGSEIGLEENEFYLAHTALFYYSPKKSLGFIGDMNNIGKSTFTFEDLLRFDGGVSNFLSGRKSLSNLISFTDDSRDLLRNKSKFSALNFNFDVSPKLVISGYSLFSKHITNSFTETKNTYLQNAISTIENTFDNQENKSILGIGNFKLDYSKKSNEKWYYNAQYSINNSNLSKTLNSITNLNSNVFETINNADSNSIKQFIEWHKKYNLKQTSTFVVNHAYNKTIPVNNWFSNTAFLSGSIPLEIDNNYLINQTKLIKNNSVDALAKHYWVIDNFNHIYSSIGNNYNYSNLITSERQQLSTGQLNNFSNAGFGNDIKYQLNDFYLGLEYKFKIGKWTNKPGLFLHQYTLKTSQFELNNKLSKTQLQPQWNSDFEFNKSETLSFEYKLANEYPEAMMLTNQFTLQNYNTVFKGNLLLENESYHSARLRYSKINMFKGLNLNSNLFLNKKTKTIRNQIELDGINQITTPILTNNPETNLRLYNTINKKIYRFNLRFNTNLSVFNYTQIVNNITTILNRNNQDLGLTLRTAFKKWPDISLGYNKGYSQFINLSTEKFNTSSLNSSFEHTFFKNLTFKIDYENFTNSNKTQSNFYEIVNTMLYYQKKNSPLAFELSANNLLNNKVKNIFTFSDYLISEETNFILPRALLFTLNYKL